jgi:hypothetical protein
MYTENLPPLSCTESQFVETFRSLGFLSPFVEEATVYYIAMNREWFDHAEALNKEGIACYNRRDGAFAGLSTHHPVSVSTRLIYRALSVFQGALILFRRAMIPEGDTLARGIYEIAFWLGYINEAGEDAVRAFVNDERKSQKGQADYYLEQMAAGALASDATVELQLREMVDRLKAEIATGESVSVKTVAKRSGLYAYYEAYKRLSSSAAHSSLNSLHRYLKPGAEGSYDGHLIGPDPDGLAESLPALCIGLGISLAMYCTIVPDAAGDLELNDLLIRTDALRLAQKESGGGLSMTL